MTEEEKITAYKYNIENSRDINEAEKDLIGEIKNGRKRKYKLFVWSMTGYISWKDIYERYNELLLKHEVLRSRIIYRNIPNPIYVTLAAEEEKFPVKDIRNSTRDKQKQLIASVLSAESRKNYNPDEDSPVKLMGFITGDSSLVVIMKIYMHYGMYVGPFDIRSTVFRGLTADVNSDIIFDEKLNSKINSAIKEKSIAHWRDIFLPVENVVKIPFAGNSETDLINQYTINKDISKELYESIRSYAEKFETDIESVILREYANFLGGINSIAEPLMAVRTRKSLMQVMPLRIKTNLESKALYKDLHNQYDSFKQYSGCPYSDIVEGIGIGSVRLFDIAFEFVNEDLSNNELNSELEFIQSNETDDFFPRIDVDIRFNSEKIGVSYVYDADAFTESAISQIHESVIRLLLERVKESVKFDWREFVTECKSDTEKVRRLEIAQKALYIKEGEFLNTDVTEEIMYLAESGHIGNYTVEDTIREAGKYINSLGILVDGHIEERYTDPNGMLKTVSIYKPGYILGMESIASEETKCAFTYTAIDKNVKVMWIPGSILRSVLLKHADSYEVLLNKALKETVRIKKAWVLD